MGVLDTDDPLYDAFRRYDQYGILGWETQPWAERARLFLMAISLVPLKFLGCVYFVGCFYLICRLSFLIPKEERAYWVQKSGCFCARAACLCIGFSKINWVMVRPNGKTDNIYTGLDDEDSPAVGAVISNHCSYIDILILMSRYFPSFVARSNTQEMPLIGLCSKHLQCIFVDREFKTGKGEIQGAAAQVKDRMEKVAAGHAVRPVLLFPEGTTTNGKMLLPFKSGAFLAGVPVQPCFIKYETNRVSPSWDSIDALWHTFLMFATLHHGVTVYLLPIYVPSEAERKDPRLYASNVRKMLMKAGGFGDSEASLVDSRAYIKMLQGKKPPSNCKAGEAWAEKYGSDGRPEAKKRR